MKSIIAGRSGAAHCGVWQARFARVLASNVRCILKTSKTSVEEIAAKVGYKDGGTVRLLLRRRLHLGVKKMRGTS
jgi:hypothetical protein